MSQNYHQPRARWQFTPAEDEMLKNVVMEIGTDNWDKVASKMPGRNARQCRDRWTNFINDQVCRDKWSVEEDALLLEKYHQFGPKWKYLETFFPGRKNYAIRNRMHSLLHKIEKLGKVRTAKPARIVEPTLPLHPPVMPPVVDMDSFLDMHEDDPIIDDFLFNFDLSDGAPNLDPWVTCLD